ncbi:FadR/GntR family transcriptional regulator [Amycolatopsis thermophila]|uniref:DNA-binding FadR family transcriptional regulator n=1 Tax=Amycolatopsis thermophila TaxID=206084 RepID=A0ABU0F2A0_9PSEU|nr:FadR/GntR family transcriptional regulator [Amycolatopsis thermophila]MDQ0381709.1 DNA-binding FadR family transcriptional regulator [Amycolatopsis thermophila]
MTELRRGPVVPQVASLLRQRLRRGDWSTGDRLPNEVQLAAEFGVGRSSVREAVRLLVQDGLLDVRHGAGTFVAAAENDTGDVRRLVRRARVLEVYEVRRALEVEAARLAAQRVRPEDVERLRAGLQERQNTKDSDPAVFVDADLAFHRAVVELSGNALLLSLFTAAEPVLREILTELVRHETDLPDSSPAHADLLEALERGDAEAAVAATVANLEPVLRGIRSAVG